MTVEPPPVTPPSSATPVPQDSPDGGGRSWAYDLVETPPDELRKRRLRRIAAGVGGALVVVALVVAVVVNLRDSGSDVVVNDSFPPHDEVLSSYMIPAPAGALPPPSPPASRDLDEAAAAEVSGSSRNLRRYKFSYGYERRWQQKDGAVVAVRLLRFRGAENAAYYLRDSLDGGVVGVDVQQRAVAGIAGGRSIISTAPVGGAGNAYVTVSAATAGDVAVLVIVAAVDREAAGAELTEGLLAAAYARL